MATAPAGNTPRALARAGEEGHAGRPVGGPSGLRSMLAPSGRRIKQHPIEADSNCNGQSTGRVDEVLAALDLSDVADRDPFTLSGGQKQRVAIACAVASGRQIVAFDEPTSGLGYGHMLQFANLLRGLSEQGRTVIVVTHDTELIERAADYLLVL